MIDTELQVSQRTIVREHFRDISVRWGARYGARPQRMSELDLVLRRENVHQLLRPELATAGRSLRVLDVGCGSGDVLNGVSRDAINVVGTDFVPEMVAQAARNHVLDRFAVGDAVNLPFASASFDVVTCLGMLEYLPDCSGALQMIRGVLRPTGCLIVSFPNQTSLFRKLSGIEISAERALRGAIRKLRGRYDRDDEGPRYRHRQWSLVDARRALESHGFAIEDMRFNTFGLWGRVGRFRASLQLSTWLSRNLGHHPTLSAQLGCTMVIRARCGELTAQRARAPS